MLGTAKAGTDGQGQAPRCRSFADDIVQTELAGSSTRPPSVLWCSPHLGEIEDSALAAHREALHRRRSCAGDGVALSGASRLPSRPGQAAIE